jgi:hypothetical protein
MPRVCWQEQLCVSCEFVTINSRCTDFLRSTVTHAFVQPRRIPRHAALKRGKNCIEIFRELRGV